MRGKAKVARALLPRSTRSAPAFVRNGDGSGMVVPNLLEPVGLSLWMDGVYEPETLQFLRRHASSNAAFVDVGANIGAFTVALAPHAERVIAIEPSPQVLPYLKKNVALNHLSNVEVAACAVSVPGCDSVPLYIPPESHFGMASSAPQFNTAPTGVPAGSLDSILRERAVGQVSVMKIDTEGYEAHVFLGAQELLRGSSPPAIVFEFCDWAEERAFPGRQGWAQEILLDADYNLWTIPDYFQERAPLSEPVTQGSHSIVGIPRKSAAKKP
ncbi:MAG TPA: FkbM family methyltransferase [Bryobacteraceae bacterium]|nr:FkbM family methyltransferase [Bryobacteraceae bacterium]